MHKHEENRFHFGEIDNRKYTEKALETLFTTALATERTAIKAGIPKKQNVWDTDKSVDSLYKIEGYNQAIDDFNQVIDGMG